LVDGVGGHGTGRDLQRDGEDVGEVGAHGAGELEEEATDGRRAWQCWRRAGGRELGMAGGVRLTGQAARASHVRRRSKGRASGASRPGPAACAVPERRRAEFRAGGARRPWPVALGGHGRWRSEAMAGGERVAGPVLWSVGAGGGMEGVGVDRGGLILKRGVIFRLYFMGSP
jgi:hypothetical protein